MKAKQNLSMLALILATKVIWSATLYVDSGTLHSLKVANHADCLYDLSVWDMQSSNSISSVHLRPRWLWRDDVAQLSRINAPWSIDKGDFHVFTPIVGGAGDVIFQNYEIKKVYTGFPAGDESFGDEVVCYRDGKVVDRRKDDVFAMAQKGLGITEGDTLVGRDEVVHVLSDRNADARPDLLRSDFSSSWAISDPSNKVIWSALDGCHWITRMPLWIRNSKAWRPCIRPELYKWVQGKIDFSKFSNGTEELCVCDVDFDGNGFNPSAAVYVVGRNVLSDNPRFAVPDEADWLIWEQDGEKSRLCKMHDGKWSVVSDAPCADVPGVIVVNNDENIVFLSFSLKFDDGDVDASMRRVVTHLREQGALHLNRLKVPVPDPDEGLSEFEKSCREDAVRQARLIEESRRRNAEELARLDAERAAANHAAEAAWLAKRNQDPPREGLAAGESTALGLADGGAKKGAMLYEREETRAEGLALLRKSAKAGNAFALARLSALYYVGEGGVKRDYAMALKLMNKAVSRGFPSFLLPMSEARERLAMQKEDAIRKNSRAAGMPGYGFKGELKTYRTSSGLRGLLEKYGLSAGWFVRDDSAPDFIAKNERKYLKSNKIPYLLYRPDTKLKSVPMLVYFGGQGERGSDLAEQFRQTTIFEKVTSKKFQDRFPCYLFAPMSPKDAGLRCQRGFRSPDADLVCDAMYAVIRDASAPKVDTNRLYLTGLSVGGSAAYTFPFGYPGRFAASLPVAGYASKNSLCEENPGSIWLICNENEYASEKSRTVLSEMAEEMKKRGGEFRVSMFPDKGHNAWDKAWREDGVWEWMFSKTVDGKAANSPSARGVALDVSDAECRASISGLDASTGPERAIDGLDATHYVSASPLRSGDSWSVSFRQPVKGTVVVKSGYGNGKAVAQSAHVETSSTGRTWNRHGGFTQEGGTCRIVLSSPVRHLRVVSDSKSGEVLVLREISIYK